MFRKLTTMIDSVLVREIEKNPESELCVSQGFRVCMELLPQLVYLGLARGHNITIGRLVEIERDFWNGNKSTDNGKLFQESLDWGRFRDAISEAQRVEVVIGLREDGQSFSWVMSPFRKDEKEPFHGMLSVRVSLDGKITPPHMMSL